MTALTHDEFKALCQWFHEAGTHKIPFEKAWEECKKASIEEFKSTLK